MTKKWMGSKPTKCNICHKPISDVMYDAKTRMGPWGILDQDCFDTYGVGLGTGLGQKYRRQVDDSFLKVGG